jgi:hypothetical protein
MYGVLEKFGLDEHNAYLDDVSDKEQQRKLLKA